MPCLKIEAWTSYFGKIQSVFCSFVNSRKLFWHTLNRCNETPHNFNSGKHKETDTKQYLSRLMMWRGVSGLVWVLFLLQLKCVRVLFFPKHRAHNDIFLCGVSYAGGLTPAAGVSLSFSFWNYSSFYLFLNSKHCKNMSYTVSYRATLEGSAFLQHVSSSERMNQWTKIFSKRMNTNFLALSRSLSSIPTARVRTQFTCTGLRFEI